MATKDSASAKILKAAAKLFATKGYDATTTRMIVAEAGSSLSAIHGHFGSKEGIYRALMEDTGATFFTLNDTIFKAIDEMFEIGNMTKENVWDQIVLLTSHLVDWVFNPLYRNEILIINHKMLGLGTNAVELPESTFALYEYFARLFAAYISVADDEWVCILAFMIVTQAFNLPNYSGALNRFIGNDVFEKHGLEKTKYNLKNYLLATIRTQLDLRTRTEEA